MIGIVLWDAMLIVFWLVASVAVDGIMAIPFALDTIGPQSRIEEVIMLVFGLVWFSAFPALLLFALVIPAWNRGF